MAGFSLLALLLPRAGPTPGNPSRAGSISGALPGPLHDLPCMGSFPCFLLMFESPPARVREPASHLVWSLVPGLDNSNQHVCLPLSLFPSSHSVFSLSSLLISISNPAPCFLISLCFSLFLHIHISITYVLETGKTASAIQETL